MDPPPLCHAATCSLVTSFQFQSRLLAVVITTFRSWRKCPFTCHNYGSLNNYLITLQRYHNHISLVIRFNHYSSLCNTIIILTITPHSATLSSFQPLLITYYTIIILPITLRHTHIPVCIIAMMLIKRCGHTGCGIYGHGQMCTVSPKSTLKVEVGKILLILFACIPSMHSRILMDDTVLYSIILSTLLNARM